MLENVKVLVFTYNSHFIRFSKFQIFNFLWPLEVSFFTALIKHSCSFFSRIRIPKNVRLHPFFVHLIVFQSNRSHSIRYLFIRFKSIWLYAVVPNVLSTVGYVTRNTSVSCVRITYTCFVGIIIMIRMGM